MTERTDASTAVSLAAEPYSFDLSLRALAGFAPTAGGHVIAGGRVRKAFLLGADAVVAEVGPGAPGSGPAVTLHAERHLSPGERAAVHQAVGRWLGLDDDLTGFLDVAERDPAMATLLRAAHGLHQVRFGSLAEGTVYFALIQRSTQWYAAARKRRVAAELGPRLRLDGVEHVAFPSLATVSALDDRDLIRFAGSRLRAARVREVVDGVAALDEEWLRTGPYDEVRKALLAVPGIGTFTAHALLLRVLGRPDDVPLEMAQFEDAARRLYGDPPPSPAELRAAYGPLVGWWAYYARTAASWLPQDTAVAVPA
ncbi:DNA-3-methyladenine glycosylase family protein [Phytohabitans kaempferiae]|uniref:DNA-3-methyladenine glycosylase family protein n=1 Tax=Phytohabitans kaempferiae TaxID=1620943 RepID=A0ABV6MCI4_9ACTN